jgi:hypothetical protein
MKANWIGHILRRNILKKHNVKGKVEEKIKVTGKQVIRRKLLLYDFWETIGYWKLKEEALYCILCRSHSLRVYGPVVRQTME